MKEAAGEANLTVVAIILIGVIAGVATLIVNNMMSSTQNRADCMNQGLCPNETGTGCVECTGITK